MALKQYPPTVKDKNITKTDSDIINDFLEFELKKDRYKNKKGFSNLYHKRGN